MEGANAEPVRVKDINAGATGSSPTGLVDFGGTQIVSAAEFLQRLGSRNVDALRN